MLGTHKDRTRNPLIFRVHPRRICHADRQGPVHPRTRGEHKLGAASPLFTVGSSPHARGTRLHGPGSDRDGRFIPACAGNTTSSVKRALIWTVHPRAIHSRPYAIRFIPARAGNTTQCPGGLGVTAVHPRARGEHGYGRLRWDCCSYSAIRPFGINGIVACSVMRALKTFSMKWFVHISRLMA